jgi:hypothetical protein
MITRQRFTELTTLVIDNFEGGYYHPDMMAGMNAASRAILAASGETMYGLDRKAGDQLAQYPEWRVFWSVIDKAGARDTWKHYYMGGSYAPELKQLAGAIMYQWFNKLAARYLTAADITKIEADERLIIHFAYACWNGEGWFKRFAAALRKATGTREQIFQAAISARTMSTVAAIRNAGRKMVALFEKEGMV